MADFLLNLLYKLVKMVGYGSENDPISSDFEMFTFIYCFFIILVTKLRPTVFCSGKNTSQDFWNMPFLGLIKFHGFRGPKGSFVVNIFNCYFLFPALTAGRHGSFPCHLIFAFVAYLRSIKIKICYFECLFWRLLVSISVY